MGQLRNVPGTIQRLLHTLDNGILALYLKNLMRLHLYLNSQGCLVFQHYTFILLISEFSDYVYFKLKTNKNY